MARSRPEMPSTFSMAALLFDRQSLTCGFEPRKNFGQPGFMPSRARLGRVLAWEPHSRLMLSWDITADWQYDPALQTEIEVRFVTEGDAGTRVEFEHRRLDRYADRRDEMRTIYDKTGDWGRLLAAFARIARTSREV